MRLSELFEELSVGELSQLSMSNDGSGEIVEKYHNKLIVYINNSLLKLYTRFPLKTNELLVEQHEHITNYHLKRDFAQSADSDQPYRYISDLGGEPFKGGVLKILEVSDLLGGQLLGAEHPACELLLMRRTERMSQGLAAQPYLQGSGGYER